MEFVDKNILLISPEPWNHIFVSKHHYAVELARRGNNVIFLNPPVDSFSVLNTGFHGLSSVFYPGFIKGLRFFPAHLRRQYIKSMFKKLEEIIGLRFDIVWSFDNSVFFDFHALEERVFKILHIVDLNQDFQFGISARTADLCLSTSRYVIDKFYRYNSNVCFVNHGVSDFSFRSKRCIALPGQNKIKACYAGNLDLKYVDWRLIETLVNQNPDVDFVMAGPWSNQARIAQFRNKANFFYIGSLSFEELSSFYQAADLLFLCYNADEFGGQVANPHKMMEYFASGKMICATFTEEYIKLAAEGLFSMSLKRSSYCELFKACVSNLSFWNSEHFRALRVNFARDNTYENQLNRIQQMTVFKLQ